MSETYPSEQFDEVDVESTPQVNEPQQEQQQQRSSSSPISFSFRFILTPSGIMMLINWVFLLLAWTIMAGWKDAAQRGSVGEFGPGKIGFFMFSTLTPWLAFVVLFVILLFGLHKKITFINWPLSMAINCGIWAFFLLIASSIIAGTVGDFENEFAYYNDIKENSLKAAAAFGFFSLVGVIIQGIMHFIEFRKG